MPRSKPPLVYSCSGCSSAAQMANQMALRLDREQLAEMSCIAGVGGGVPALVRTAKGGRPILALDGCAMACVRACLARVDVQPSVHLVLADYGVRKRRHTDADAEEANAILVAHVRPAALDLADRARGLADAQD